MFCFQQSWNFRYCVSKIVEKQVHVLVFGIQIHVHVHVLASLMNEYSLNDLS